MPYAKVNGIDLFYEIAEVEQRAAPMLPCSNARRSPELTCPSPK